MPDDVLRGLCDRSYALVFGKLTKKLQRAIEGQQRNRRPTPRKRSENRPQIWLFRPICAIVAGVKGTGNSCPGPTILLIQGRALETKGPAPRRPRRRRQRNPQALSALLAVAVAWLSLHWVTNGRAAPHPNGAGADNGGIFGARPIHRSGRSRNRSPLTVSCVGGLYLGTDAC